MAIEISGKNLSIDLLVDVSRNNKKICLSKDSEDKIVKCRQMVEDKISAGEIMYGINTGIGEFSETVLDPTQIKDFQKYLIYNHAAGIGDPAPLAHVRAAMLSRINVHAKGMSGCRLVITQTLVQMINKGVTPYVCEKGSVGACGDLAPMSQIALVLLGEGKAYFDGELLEGKDLRKTIIDIIDHSYLKGRAGDYYRAHMTIMNPEYMNEYMIGNMIEFLIKYDMIEYMIENMIDFFG